MEVATALLLARLSAVVSVAMLLYCVYLLFQGWQPKKMLVSGAVLAVALTATCVWAPQMVDSLLNSVVVLNIPAPSPEARALHEKLWIADMHADTLLWLRDMVSGTDWGHVDLPRLVDGNVAMQAFTIVTGVPPKMSFDSNPAPSLLSDSITLKAVGERWGWASVTSRAARTLYQAGKLYDVAARSDGRLVVVESRKDLEAFIARREAEGGGIVAAFLGIEGLQALDGNVDNVDKFFDAGVRMMALTHFYDNLLGGSAAGEEQAGVTPLGRQVLARMELLNITVDIAHASEDTIDDVVKLTTRPLINSHTGVRGVCDSPRNLQDKHVEAVARSGGLLSVGFFRPAICGDDDIDSIVATMRYITDLVGVEHVALGSDFDGAVSVPFDSAHLIFLTDRLLHKGFTEAEVSAIMGGNAKRFWLANLPPQ